jgi:hypothetical protein
MVLQKVSPASAALRGERMKGRWLLACLIAAVSLQTAAQTPAPGGKPGARETAGREGPTEPVTRATETKRTFGKVQRLPDVDPPPPPPPPGKLEMLKGR